MQGGISGVPLAARFLRSDPHQSAIGNGDRYVRLFDRGRDESCSFGGLRPPVSDGFILWPTAHRETKPN
jgi:hypothetical protein